MRSSSIHPFMGYHPRIESKKYAAFLTTRCRNSELWFVNNKPLEDAILGYLAKYTTYYGVKVYAFAIEGNHKQGPAHFPNANRADFMRDFNSSVARVLPRHTPEYPGGNLWERRYSAEVVPDPVSIEKYFFYTALQPVQDGLVARISEYPGYNCFEDAIRGRKRKYKVVRWGEYNAARRYNRDVSIEDYTEIVELEFARLPGYEHLSQEEYAKLMREKLLKLQAEIVRERRAKGLGFLGREKLLAIPRGAKPLHTKKSGRYDHRPRVLCSCPKLRAEVLKWYFAKYYAYREASKLYRAGDFMVKFPEGMYPPHLRACISPPENGGEVSFL